MRDKGDWLGLRLVCFDTHSDGRKCSAHGELVSDEAFE